MKFCLVPLKKLLIYKAIKPVWTYRGNEIQYNTIQIQQYICANGKHNKRLKDHINLEESSIRKLRKYKPIGCKIFNLYSNEPALLLLFINFERMKLKGLLDD